MAKSKKTSNKRIPVLGPSYNEKSKNLNAQRTINWYPTKTYDGKAEIGLEPTPGSVPVMANANSTANPSYLEPLAITDGPTMFAVKDFGGTATPPYTTATNRALSVINPQTSNVADIFTFNGQSYSNSSIYINLRDGLDQGFGHVAWVHADWGGSNYSNAMILDKANYSNTFTAKWEPPIRPSDICFYDGYWVINHISKDNRNDPYGGYFYANTGTDTAAPYTGSIIKNGTWWKSQDAYVMYYRPDVVVRLIATGSYLYVFGGNHYEVWYNTGNTDNTLEPIKEATKEIGLAGPETVAKYQNYIFFVGTTNNVYTGVYMIDGLECKKISTYWIDRIMQNSTQYGFTPYDQSYWLADRWNNFCYNHNGHVFYVMYAPGTNLVYDVTTDAWHEQSPGVENGYMLPRYNTEAPPWVYSITQTGDIIRLDDSVCTYFKRYGNGTCANVPLERTRITQHISGEDHHVFHDRFRVDFEANSKISQDVNISAPIILYSSDDDTKTWYNHGEKSLSNISYGSVSGDKRVEWFRLGRSDDRIYKIWTNANYPVTLDGAFVDITRGSR